MKTSSSKIFLSVVFYLLLQGCESKTKNKSMWGEQIIKTDEAFSEMSKAWGMKKAFIEFMDSDGILLRPNHLPIIGADAIEYLTRQNDTAFTLTWKPASVQVAASGDLGFTFGVYDLQLKDTLLKGTYVSIWKKQKDGKWKFVLDSGNEGIRMDTLSIN